MFVIGLNVRLLRKYNCCVQLKNSNESAYKMININSNTEKILDELSKGILSIAEIVYLFNDSKDFPKELIEELSLATALKYWNGQLSYQDGDMIMNNLFIGCIHNQTDFENYHFPTTAWECYLAFDSGEFYRPNDDKSVDPAEKYTKPLVEELLKKRNIIP